MGVILTLVHSNIWIDLDRHMPRSADARHQHAYEGHTDVFYINGTDLFVLNILHTGAGTCFFVGAIMMLVSRALNRKPKMP
jgi:hypothetical protein